MQLYHGTAGVLGSIIEREGFRLELGPLYSTPFSEPGYVYFTTDLRLANEYAVARTAAVGIGTTAVVYAVDSESLPGDLTPDNGPGMDRAWRHAGEVPAHLIRKFSEFEVRAHMVKRVTVMGQFQLSVFERDGDRLLFSHWLPNVSEEEVRRVFAIPPDVWHGYEKEVVTDNQRDWLAVALPDLEIEWDRCEAFVGLCER